MSNPSEFTSDAWILLAILYSRCEKGADLRAIIGAADYINHAILTYEELRDGLVRLRAAGYIREQDGFYHPTQMTLSAYERTTKPHRPVRREWDDLAQFLRTSGFNSHALADSTADQVIITQTMYENAVQTYIQENQVSTTQ
ncbi:MAG TPA: hypothetical protein PKH77_03380 [Anaerolineae bacterium]|nr:hypothetical protein [Anaerolineae bacterium]